MKLDKRIAQLGNTYYLGDWDEKSWVGVIEVEYQQLISGFPFGDAFRDLGNGKSMRLLDIGCGTAIFPALLDPFLPEGVTLLSDLLDNSQSSLNAAGQVFEKLKHFEVNELRLASIEGIPQDFDPLERSYEVIWAIHSFTTVELSQMKSVFRRILSLLVENGFFFIFQLTADSTYQKLHSYYRDNYPQANNVKPFMQFEDSRTILDEIGRDYELREFNFDHRIPVSEPEVLAKYLRKCILNENLDAIEFFREKLGQYLDTTNREYRFPQQVNLIIVRGN